MNFKNHIRCVKVIKENKLQSKLTAKSFSKYISKSRQLKSCLITMVKKRKEKISSEQLFLEQNCLVDTRGSSRIAKRFQADRKATLTQAPATIGNASISNLEADGLRQQATT